MSKPAVSGELFPQIKTGPTIETVQLKGCIGYIVLDGPSSEFIKQTNDMIDWAKWSWNPATGCKHDCPYCYARGIANSPGMAQHYPHQFEPTLHLERLKAPANTSFPKTIHCPQDRNVFVCSMADLFGKWVPDEWIVKVFEQVQRYPQWNYLFLTKFPQRLRSVCDDLLGGFPDNASVGCTVDSQARVKTAQKHSGDCVRRFAGCRSNLCWSHSPSPICRCLICW